MALPLFNIGGLASGLDTNAIVAGLMAAARTPINQLEARKGAYEAKDAAWQAVNTRLAAVGTALEAIKSPLDFDRFATAASSYEPAVTASPIGPATPSALSFTVDQLATNHQMNSATSFTSGSDLVGAGDFTITQGGEDLVITTSPSTTLSDLAQQINGLDSDVSANVIGLDATTFKLVLSADDTGVGRSVHILRNDGEPVDDGRDASRGGRTAHDGRWSRSAHDHAVIEQHHRPHLRRKPRPARCEPEPGDGDRGP